MQLASENILFLLEEKKNYEEWRIDLLRKECNQAKKLTKEDVGISELDEDYDILLVDGRESFSPARTVEVSQINEIEEVVVLSEEVNEFENRDDYCLISPVYKYGSLDWRGILCKYRWHKNHNL